MAAFFNRGPECFASPESDARDTLYKVAEGELLAALGQRGEENKEMERSDKTPVVKNRCK